MAQATTPVPVEAFFAPAKLQDAKLSPSGRWMAALTSVPGRRVGLQMMDLEGKDGSYFIEAAAKDDVSWFEWVSDDWLIFKVRDPNDRSIGAKGAGLMALKRDGSGSRMLISREFEMEDPFQRRRYLEPDYDYVGLGAPGTNEVIVEQSVFGVAVGTRREFSHNMPKALNVATSALRTLGDAAPRADSWWYDGKGVPRAARRQTEGTTTTWWADSSGKWIEIDKSPALELPFSPAYVDGDNDLVVRWSTKAGDLELRRFDFAANKPGKSVLLKTEGFSGGAVPVRDRGSQTVAGLTLAVDSVMQAWLTPAMKAIQAKVDAKFPSHNNLLQCQPCDNPRVVLVFSYSDTDPGNYVLYRPQTDSWQLVGQVRPEIDPRRMASLELHRAKARDGQDLPIWVTQPQKPKGSENKPAPAVVLVHGGPSVRGTYYEWNAEAQFLASRGYVVIEPEFRGSTGYGYEHYRAGWKQWGQAMQDDVTDALKFAVAKGWADPSRACIMGASYGGYSALMGLVKDPDQYRCGIAFAAVADPRFLYEFHWSDAGAEGRKYDLPKLVGDPKTDAAMLAAASPLERAAAIKQPLLLVHGARDRRVPVQNGERMRDALRKNGKDFEWLEYADEGHWFYFDKNMFDYYRRVEAFLAKNLKP